MYESEERLITLNNYIDVAKNKLKAKLTNKNVAYPPNASLRKLISLIPENIFIPINLYQTLAGHTVVSITDSEIIFCGGYNNNGSNNNIQKLYNINTNTFATKRNLSTNISQHAGAKWDNVIYYTGGTTGGPYDTINKNQAYNTQSNTFTTKANMPQNRGYHTFVTTDSFLLISGGYGGNTDFRSQYTYTVSSNSYTARGNMLRPSKKLATAHTTDNKVLINGGSSIDNYIYDIRANTTTSKRNLTGFRTDHASLKVNNDLVLISGGVPESITQYWETEVFNLTSNTFTAREAPPYGFYDHTLAKTTNDFLFSGGLLNWQYEVTNKQFKYNYEKNKYTSSS